jgi:hypothetical protein
MIECLLSWSVTVEDESPWRNIWKLKHNTSFIGGKQINKTHWRRWSKWQPSDSLTLERAAIWASSTLFCQFSDKYWLVDPLICFCLRMLNCWILNCCFCRYYREILQMRIKCFRKFFLITEELNPEKDEYSRFATCSEELNDFDSIYDRWVLDPVKWWANHRQPIPMLQKASS